MEDPPNDQGRETVPTVTVSFVGIGKLNVPENVAKSILAIKISLEKYSEANNNKIKFDLELELTDNNKKSIKKALTVYLRCKMDALNNKISDDSVKSISALEPIDWTHLMVLTHRFADLDFFDGQFAPEYPSLDFLANVIFMMPPQYIVIFMEIYLGDCFYPDCECAKVQAELEQKELEVWWKTLPEDEAKKLRLTYNYSKSYSFDMYFGIDRGDIYDWYNLGQDISEKLTSLFDPVKKIACTCLFNVQATAFYAKWNLFYTTHPNLAVFMWENMDREELLKIGKVPTKKKNRMKKSTFGEMIEYVEKFRPKEFSRDPQEQKLRRELASAKRGIPVGMYGSRYINSEDIVLAEAKLNKYLTDRKKNKQREHAKQAKKANENCYTCSAFDIKISLVSIQGRRKRRK